MSAAVQQRARHLLTDACSNGRLDVALAKLDGYCNAADVLDVAKPKVTSDTYAGTYASVTTATDGFGQTLQTLSNASPRDSFVASDVVSLADNQMSRQVSGVKKKRGHGRDLEDALKLGACLAAPADDHSPGSRPGTTGSKGRRGSKASVKITLEEDPEVVAQRHAEWEAKKYAAAVEQAAKQERARLLYLKRTEYCEAKLRPMVEKLVSDVSSEARPANPVPLMIELLAEYANKPVRAFKGCTPENRLKREIRDLQKQVDELEKIVDAPYVLEEGSEEEEETCDEDEDVEPEDVDVSKAAA